MSMPAVNKLRLLAKAAPPLPHPVPIFKTKSPTLSSNGKTRGAILAIEGSEDDVRVVTEWLGEFLKNETDEFLVRTFLGPDISAVMVGTEREENTDIFGTQQQRYLKAISEWHWVSKEVVTFVTTAPTTKDARLAESNAGSNADDEAAKQRGEQEDEDMDLNSKSSPTSAVSPRTITQTERLSLGNAANNNPAAAADEHRPAMPISPPSPAWKPSPPPTTRPLIPTPPPPHPPPPHLPTTNSTPQDHNHRQRPFPIALLPRYQLSTVDTASLAMPITDSYLPIDHWQWAAALWRGCVGADVTIVIQDERSPPSYGSVSSGGLGGSVGGAGGSNNSPGSGSASGTGGVEVRLGPGDVRAVIVRKGTSGNGNGGESKVVEAGALRRVGFEIVEFLRR